MALPKEKFEEIKSKIQKFIDHEMVANENDLSFNHKFADHLSFLEEKRNMEDWNLTAETMMSKEEWRTFFIESNFHGDYYWFIP